MNGQLRDVGIRYATFPALTSCSLGALPIHFTADQTHDTGLLYRTTT